jgi:hypothetical protein
MLRGVQNERFPFEIDTEKVLLGSSCSTLELERG